MYKELFKESVGSPAVNDIWRWSKPLRMPVVGLSVLTLMNTASSLTITLATKELIDSACSRDRNELISSALTLVVAAVLVRILTYIYSRLLARTSFRCLRHLRTIVLNELLHKQYSGVSRFHSGELVNRLFSDINLVRNGIVSVVPTIVSMFVSLTGASVILIRMDWRFMILLVGCGLVGTAMALMLRTPMKERHRRMQESEGRLHSFIQETLENIRIIKASGSEQRMEKQSEVRMSDYYDVQMKRENMNIYLSTGIGAVYQISWLLCMILGGMSIYKGTLTYGSLAAVIQLVGYIQVPLSGLVSIAGQIYQTITSAERLKELLNLPDDDTACVEERDEKYSRLSRISFEHVSFKYSGETVLDDVCARLDKGDFAALTGISGCGKSTLFQLLMGIYQPSGGRIVLEYDDGTTETVTARTRSLFGYVPQGNMLFSGTLRENLALFTDSATDEEIMDAAKLACIDTFISELEDGLDTVIGERGLGLSEGQAQRIAMARTLLSKSPILLLDESTSALDEHTEAQLLKNLSELRSKTCIIVTHRQAALSICNRNLQMENGKLTENIDSLQRIS